MGNYIRWLPPEAGTTWDRVKLYSALVSTGPFVLLKDLDVSHSSYWHEDAATGTYYKLSFYDSKTLVESALSDAFAPSSTPVINTKELRRFVGLLDSDQPDDEILMSLIVDANIEMQLDITFTSTSSSKLALKLLTGAYVAQWRGTRLMGSGNVQFAIDGVSVQKPYQQWMERAKQYREDYDEFIWKYAEEVMVTMPISDAGYEDQSMNYVDILHGINNARNMLDLRSEYGDNTVIVTNP
jgi:hypothetical protein